MNINKKKVVNLTWYPNGVQLHLGRLTWIPTHHRSMKWNFDTLYQLTIQVRIAIVELVHSL